MERWKDAEDDRQKFILGDEGFFSVFPLLLSHTFTYIYASYLLGWTALELL